MFVVRCYSISHQFLSKRGKRACSTSLFAFHCSFMLHSFYPQLHTFFISTRPGTWVLCWFPVLQTVRTWHGSWSQNRFGDAWIYFIFPLSLFNMLRWSVQIADRGSSGDGGGGCCPGIFIPRKMLYCDLYDLSLTLTEKERECWGKNRNCNHSMLEGNASGSRKKKDHYAQSLFFVKNWKETSIAL